MESRSGVSKEEGVEVCVGSQRFSKVRMESQNGVFEGGPEGPKEGPEGGSGSLKGGKGEGRGSAKGSPEGLEGFC